MTHLPVPLLRISEEEGEYKLEVIFKRSNNPFCNNAVLNMFV